MWDPHLALLRQNNNRGKKERGGGKLPVLVVVVAVSVTAVHFWPALAFTASSHVTLLLPSDLNT
jgi:hypothetical protein